MKFVHKVEGVITFNMSFLEIPIHEELQAPPVINILNGDDTDDDIVYPSFEPVTDDDDDIVYPPIAPPRQRVRLSAEDRKIEGDLLDDFESEDDEEPEDEYDLDDSFIDDGEEPPPNSPGFYNRIDDMLDAEEYERTGQLRRNVVRRVKGSQ